MVNRMNPLAEEKEKDVLLGVDKQPYRQGPP